MTEEFLHIFEKIGRTPFEEKVKQSIESFENLVHLFMEMPEKIDSRLDSIQAQINSLEAQIKILVKKIAEIQGSSIITQSGPVPPRKVNPAEAKRDVMNELQDLLEKRKRELDDTH